MTFGGFTPTASRLGRVVGKRKVIEKLWRKFFANPSEWWDHRLEKINSRYPDFKHKTTTAALWLDGKSNPVWVEAKLAEMAQGTVLSDIFSWNRRLSRHVEAREYEQVINSFHEMQREGTVPDKSVFLKVLKACASSRALDEGRHVHEQITQFGCESDVYVSSSLVDMYAKCGSINESRKVFNKMPTRSVVSWNAMIQGYVKHGQGHKALILFRQMQLEGVKPDDITFVGVLNACAALGELEQGKRLHEQIIRSGFDVDVLVGNSLIDMYAKCGSIVGARKAFDKISTRNVITWNAMIHGYAKCGQGFKALQLFQQMLQEGIQPVSVTFVGVINACASVAALEQGRKVHEDVIQRDCESDVFVGSSLIDMYAKCGSPVDARKVFDKMPFRNVVSWNAMILGYVKCGQGQKALELFQNMLRDGVKPDRLTFVGLLNACASIAALEEGRQVHERIIESGCEMEVFIGNSLIDMYAKCGSIEDVWRVFKKMTKRSMVTWNTMILVLVKCGQGQKALEVFRQMQREGVKPDSVTFMRALNACASEGALNEGKRLHKQIIENGCEFDIFLNNSLIDMYSNCGSTLDARKVFNKMPSRNVVSWNAMILGYANCGHGQKALELSQQMQREGMTPDSVTFVGMLNGCASTKALEDGKRVHEQMIESGCESAVFVSSSLVDMYVKCGSIEDAWRVFDNMSIRSAATWNAMIMGFANYGEGQKSLDLFHQMLKDGRKPDSMTFVGVLKACARMRLLEEGKDIHEHILQNGYLFDVVLSNGLIDMYAQCGSIEDARRIFNQMQKRNVYSWNAMILGYAKCGQEQNALALSAQMQQERDPVSFEGMLDNSVGADAFEEGRLVYEQIIQSDCESEILMDSSIVDMYDKYGSFKDRHRALNKLSTIKVTS